MFNLQCFDAVGWAFIGRGIWPVRSYDIEKSLLLEPQCDQEQLITWNRRGIERKTGGEREEEEEESYVYLNYKPLYFLFLLDIYCVIELLCFGKWPDWPHSM